MLLTPLSVSLPLLQNSIQKSNGLTGISIWSQDMPFSWLWQAKDPPNPFRWCTEPHVIWLLQIFDLFWYHTYPGNWPVLCSKKTPSFLTVRSLYLLFLLPVLFFPWFLCITGSFFVIHSSSHPRSKRSFMTTHQKQPTHSLTYPFFTHVYQYLMFCLLTVSPTRT